MSGSDRGRRWWGALLFGWSVLLSACGSPAEEEKPPPAGPLSCGAGETEAGSTCCAAGSLPLPEGGCLDAGVTDCGEGFEPDGGGGCIAVLPAVPCGPGLVALPGENRCREIAPCGAPPWGSIVSEATTQHVDASYAGGDSDGSAARPWTTIAEGIAAASSGAIVAIAQGSYAPAEVRIEDKAVRLWGRCPSLVDVDTSGVFVVRAGGAEIRGIGVHGSLAGIVVLDSEDVRIQEVWVHDTADRGIYVTDEVGPVSLAIEQSLVEATREIGITLLGARADIARTTVRATVPAAGEAQGGIGIAVAQGSEATVERSVLAQNGELGMMVEAASLAMSDTLITDTAVQPSGPGYGLYVRASQTGQRANVTVARSIVDNSLVFGVLVESSDALFEDLTVRRTRGPGLYPHIGSGMLLASAAGAPPSEVTVRGCRVEQSYQMGLSVVGANALVEGCIVGDVTPAAAQPAGRSINVHPFTQTDPPVLSDLVLRGSRIAPNVEMGILVAESTARIESVWVAGSAPRADGRFGDGIAVVTLALPGSADIVASRVESAGRAGISSFGARVSLADTRLDCNAIDLDGENDALGASGAFEFEDLGGNACGCGDDQVACAVQSSGLEPPAVSPASP